jgi:hypothetical protein
MKRLRDMSRDERRRLLLRYRLRALLYPSVWAALITCGAVAGLGTVVVPFLSRDIHTVELVSLVRWLTVGLGGVLGGLVLATRWRTVTGKLLRHDLPDVCIKCGYDVGGLDSKRCPECGTAIPADGAEDK